MMDLGMVDFERGTKVAGFRGYFLKGDGALLSTAIWQLAQKHWVARRFEPMIVPSLVRREAFLGTGYLPQGEEDLYKTQDGDYPCGHGGGRDDGVLHGRDHRPHEGCPIKFFSFSPCFRREAGAHGKDTKGLIRLHEFYKYEQVVLCEASHRPASNSHEELTKNSEEFLQSSTSRIMSSSIAAAISASAKLRSTTLSVGCHQRRNTARRTRPLTSMISRRGD